jgi:hypothetical protein
MPLFVGVRQRGSSGSGYLKIYKRSQHLANIKNKQLILPEHKLNILNTAYVNYFFGKGLSKLP